MSKNRVFGNYLTKNNKLYEMTKTNSVFEMSKNRLIRRYLTEKTEIMKQRYIALYLK